MSDKNAKKVLLRVEHLCQYFKMGNDVLKAVDDISFDIRKGEVFGLVGESGCGKTTTGRSIIKIYDITSGNIYFKGQLISSGKRDKETRKELRISQKNKVSSKIQMIFQDPVASLNPRMTVREIISEGLVINGIRDREYIDQKVYEILELVGLVRDHAGRYPHEFSGGQRQRIGIARALIMRPELLIADEPISALDVSVQAQVMNLLNELRTKLGLTILFIAHDLSVVKYFCDRIGVMYFGKIVELASSDELFAHPIHPYTRSLLSAIPLPDPRSEKKRVRIAYNAQTEHDYRIDTPSMREITGEHFVYCSALEEMRYKKELGL